MGTVLKLTLTKTDLDKMPDDERTFYLMAGQIANDMNILGKLAIMAIHECGEAESHPERSARLTQTFLVVKLFAGRIFEAKNLIDGAFNGKKLRTKYLADLSPLAKDGLTKMGQYFGKKNAIETVRNRFAFHFDREDVEATYQAIPADSAFIDYLSPKYIGHNLFFGAEMLSLNAMRDAMGAATLDAALYKFLGETVSMSMAIGHFVTGFLGLMRNRYLGVKLSDCDEVTVNDERSIYDFSIPFFCGPPLPPPRRA